MSIVRATLALVLGVIIFVGFLFYLILNNFSDKLLSADFYNDTIEGQDAYNRIYDEVLVDEELLDRTAELLGDISVVSDEEIVELMREIVPLEYVQAQVEGSVERTIAYVKEEVDELEIYIDLAEPLRNVKPVMFAYIDGRIDGLQVEDPAIGSCTAQAVTDLAEEYTEKLSAIALGEVPTSVPSLQALDAPCRQALFASAFDLLLVSRALDAETTQRLLDNREVLREPFEAGDTLGMLKVSARTLADPLMDKGIAKIREDLGPRDRLDLIQQLAEWDTNTTEAELREDLDEGRKWVSRARDFGQVTTLLMVIGGAILMGLVYLPNMAAMLRWPGLALVITGLITFILGKIAESQVPDRLAKVVEVGVDKATDVPPSVTDLGGDILISFGTQITSGIAGPSVTLMIIGAVLIGASFFTGPIKLGLSAIKGSVSFLNRTAKPDEPDELSRPAEPIDPVEPVDPIEPIELDDPDGLDDPGEPESLDEPKEPAP